MGKRFLFFSKAPRAALKPTQTPIRLVPPALFPGRDSDLCVLERVCSQTQLCQLRCLMTILDNYMFRLLLAIFRLSLRELKVLLYNVRARDGEIYSH